MENIVRFMKGKKKGYIGYNSDGKVILARNKVQAGYYKLSNIEEKDNVILANAERIPYDYFPKITYDEFLKVLDYNGFKIGFIENFCYVCGEYSGNDHLVFAYNMENHIVIVAQSWDSGKCFNSIDLYCPGVNCFDANNNKLFSQGSPLVSVFDLCRDDVFDKNKGAIHIFKERMEEVEDNSYKENESISLWNYSETEGIDRKDFYEKSYQKIKRADRKDMLELFSQSKIMMKALKMKRIKFEIEMEINDDFIDEAKKWEHHAEYLLDLDSNPEIKSVHGCKVTVLK